MTLGSGSQSESALLAYNKRKAQLERWRGSDTEKESIEIRSRPKRVKFADKCIFQAACASNDKGQVARMIREGYDINAVDEDGITALHQACIEDNFDMVEFLLENGADVNISDNEGWTPLHAVATCCYVSIAKLLMEHGANVVALNNDCSIPLDICKSDEIRELFIQEINGKGIDLKDARRGEEVKMMDDAKRWLANGAVDEKPHPVTGATAMHVAACKGYIKVLDLLIKAGANMNSQDFDGWTPLHAAAHWGQKEACEVLLEHMCDMSLRNNCDQTALDIADSSVVPLLEEWKKRHDVNKNIDTHNVGKQNLNNLNNNNNNAVTVPPKKKPVPRPTPDDDVTIVTSQLSQDKPSSNLSNSISDDEPLLPQDEDVEEEEEQLVDVVDVDEAEDTVSELPSTSTTDPMAPEPISFVHSTSPLPTGGGGGGSPTTSSLPPVVVTTSSSSASINQPPSSTTTSNSSSSSETSGQIAESKRGGGGGTPSISAVVPSVESFTKLVAESHTAADTDTTGHSWRRGGSLRTRTTTATSSTSTSPATSSTSSPAGAGGTAGEETTASKGNNERLRRPRGDAMAGDSSLRRAYSFESDAKFYSRLRDARNRIKAMEEASAAFSNAIDESIASIWAPTPAPPAGPGRSVGSSSSSEATAPAATNTTSSTRLNPCPEPPPPPSIASIGISTSRQVRSGTNERVPSSATSSSSIPPLTNPTSHPTTPAVTTSNSLNKNNVNTSTEPNSRIISSASSQQLHPEPSTTPGSEQEEDDMKTVVVLRRKEIETNRSLRPNTSGSPNPSSRPSSSSTATVTTPTNTTSNIPPNYSETKQTRSGVDVVGTNGGQPSSSLLFTNSSSNLSLHQPANSNSSKQSGAVTKFKNFFKSFVPPTRDEESETQRKAHAKRVRETRRSTQGVTLEELKSAEQYVKNSQSGVSNASGSGTTNSVPVSSSSSRKEQEDMSVERRPSWRLRVDEQDRSKFSLEDTRGTGSPPVPASRSAAAYHTEIPYGLAQRNPALRSKLGKGMVVDPTQLQSQQAPSAPQGKPPLPPGEESGTSAAGPQQQDEERDVKNSGGAQGAILRKKKTKRRSTGVVQFNTDGTYPERQDNVPSDSEIGREASDVEQGPESSRSENGVTQRINYKKLYEEVLKENQLLKSKLSRAEEDINELKLKLDKLSMTPRITSDESEKLEKRALERKLSEMEEELKQMQRLKLDSEKLKAENRALTRVVSKLTGASNNSNGGGGAVTPPPSPSSSITSTANGGSGATMGTEIRHLRTENQKLRDENGALIRVISKLSK